MMTCSLADLSWPRQLARQGRSRMNSNITLDKFKMKANIIFRQNQRGIGHAYTLYAATAFVEIYHVKQRQDPTILFMHDLIVVC